MAKLDSRWSVRLACLVLAALHSGCGSGPGPARQADVGGGDVPVTVTVLQTGGWDLTLVSTLELAGLDLYFADGSTEQHSLEGYQAQVHSESRALLSYLKASGKGGDYWYFDRAGKPLPQGYVPKFQSSLGPAGKSASAIWVGATQLQVSASDTYSEVKVGYNNGSIQVFVTSEASGTYDLYIPGERVEAIRITLLSDGSKWYYDAQGNTLSAGSKWYADLD